MLIDPGVGVFNKTVGVLFAARDVGLDYLRIQIEDSGNYADALGYLRKLGLEAVSPPLLLLREEAGC
jgi:hypothetical protein